MTRYPTQQQSPPEIERIEEFLRAFFGRGNTVWPDLDPDSATGRRLAPFLRVLRERSEIPVVLPRRKPNSDRLIAYVIPLNRAHATLVAESLTAFVGYSYATFDGTPARLDPTDPVDLAVLAFAGHDAVFTVTSPTTSRERATWDGLTLLQTTMRLRRGRGWHAPPRPVGRLIAEFDLALAAGDNTASADLLDQLTATGGLSAVNIAYLRIKRLARLGRDSELLRLPDLADVVATEPPVPVRDAILGAFYTTTVEESLEAGEVERARAHLIDAGTVVPALLDTSPASLSTDALIIMALAGLIRNDAAALDLLRDSPGDLARLAQSAPALALEIATVTQPSTTPTQPTPTTPMDRSTPTSWVELVTAVAAGGDATRALSEEPWREWDRPSVADAEIAAILADLDDTASERAWILVGPFIDADGYQTPAPRSARAFLDHAFVHDRFRPADVAGLVALTEIILRSGPGVADYTALLDDIAATHNRWVGPDRAPTVLDMVDLLARMPCPNPEARLRLSICLLTPLRDHHHRLDADQLVLARLLSDELNTQLLWPNRDVEATPLAEYPATSVLLYSLDEHVLARTATALAAITPNLTVKTSHDKVGSSRLRQLVRNADLIVMATRCATHAATGFIRAHARNAITTEADGSGSASLTRAAMAALQRQQKDNM